MNFLPEGSRDKEQDLIDLYETFIRGVSLAKDQCNKLWELSG